ncbi:MAG: LamB/YcsF family protein [Propionibacterium sp.]|nr:LamB/YcsF family protein [Propionibacterium sp.]
MTSIDLNSDLGENTADRPVSDDATMLNVVSSANVAAGFHAGSPAGIRQTLIAARDRGVVVGVHPGYNDYENFGRVALDIDDATLQAEVEYQLGALMGLAASVGVRVAYVKPHGALYNTIARDEHLAQVVTDAIKAVDPTLVFLGLAGGVSVEVAERSGLTVAREAFADRAYEPDGDLVSRKKPGAVLHDPDVVAERMLSLVHEQTITAIDGSRIRIQADSICVHGDSAGAIQMASAVRARLTAAGVEIASFVQR